MFGVLFWAFLATVITGLATKYVLDQQYNTTKSITWYEFAIAVTAIFLVIGPSVAWLGWKIARDNAVTYNEYQNGWELKAIKTDIPCTRDGSCVHDYSCDPYVVMVSYSCNCDSKGDCSTCYRPETRYHSCPYVDVESDYTIKTTLGEYIIGSHRLPYDPQKHRWRKNKVVSQNVIDYAGTGEPPFWTCAKERLNQGKPGPATARHTYENYILASDRTILKQYSSQIESYKKLNLLPMIVHDTSEFYYAKKVYTIGFNTDLSPWSNAVMYINAALGSELQGDLHLVLVQNDIINRDPDTYSIALRVYWLNKEVFGRNTLSKNGIVVVLGTNDGKSVAWARAFTGMPIGNEVMISTIQDRLKGLPFTPENTVGIIRGWFDHDAIKSAHSSGALDNILWGLNGPETKFQRYSMSGKTGIGSGFLYLRNDIQPSTTAKVWISIVVFLVSGIVWIIVAYTGDDYSKSKRNQSNLHWRRSRL
jgi:hypothetical protein